jgi:hypothetical protein
MWCSTESQILSRRLCCDERDMHNRHLKRERTKLGKEIKEDTDIQANSEASQ